MQSLLTTVGLNVIRKTKRLIIKQDIGTPRHKTEFAYPPPPGYFKRLLQQLRFHGFASAVNSRHDKFVRHAVKNQTRPRNMDHELLASKVEKWASMFSGLITCHVSQGCNKNGF